VSTPLLKGYGLQVKKRLVQNFDVIRCKRGQILETEGQMAKFAYIVIKGRVLIYKKLFNDEIKDSNKVRSERASII
jgi:CRP-like cAMP-binding protein